MDPRDSLVDAGVISAFMEKAVLPRDTVNYQMPGYWDRPFVNNDIVDIASGSGWVTVINQPPPEDPYTLIIQKYILTTEDTLPATGVEFRIMTDDGLLPHTDFAQGVERHRQATFPLRGQRLFFPVTINDNIMLECRNTTGSPIRVLAALWGWLMWSPDSAGELDSRREGMVDV